MMKNTALFLLIMTLGSAQVQATTVVAMDLDELTSRSDAIVVGTVKSVGHATNPTTGYPETLTQVTVDESIYGDKSMTETTLATIGGPAGGGTVTVVPGMPRFKKDERVLLFLVKNATTGNTLPTGLEQGVFRIKVDPESESEYIVNQSVDLGVTSLKPVSEKQSKEKSERVLLGDFKRLVKEKISELKKE